MTGGGWHRSESEDDVRRVFTQRFPLMERRSIISLIAYFDTGIRKKKQILVKEQLQRNLYTRAER